MRASILTSRFSSAGVWTSVTTVFAKGLVCDLNFLVKSKFESNFSQTKNSIRMLIPVVFVTTIDHYRTE